jgi:hypothetical protein
MTSSSFLRLRAASSLAAIQLANYAGATAIALTRTLEKTGRLHEAALGRGVELAFVG